MIIEFLTFSLFTLIVRYQSALQLCFSKKVCLYFLVLESAIHSNHLDFTFFTITSSSVLHTCFQQISSIFNVFFYKPDFSLTSSFLIVSLKFVCVCVLLIQVEQLHRFQCLFFFASEATQTKRTTQSKTFFSSIFHDKLKTSSKLAD